MQSYSQKRSTWIIFIQYGNCAISKVIHSFYHYHQGRLLQSIQGDNVVDYDIDAYTTRLAAILLRKQDLNDVLRGKVWCPVASCVFLFTYDTDQSLFFTVTRLSRISGQGRNNECHIKGGCKKIENPCPTPFPAAVVVDLGQKVIRNEFLSRFVAVDFVSYCYLVLLLVLVSNSNSIRRSTKYFSSLV